jgi:hypothetical protein
MSCRCCQRRRAIGQVMLDGARASVEAMHQLDRRGGGHQSRRRCVYALLRVADGRYGRWSTAPTGSDRSARGTAGPPRRRAISRRNIGVRRHRRLVASGVPPAEAVGLRSGASSSSREEPRRAPPLDPPTQPTPSPLREAAPRFRHLVLSGCLVLRRQSLRSLQETSSYCLT